MINPEFERAYVYMTLVQNIDGIAKIQKAYLETEEAKTDENEIGWKAFCEFTRLSKGRGGRIAKLEEMVDEHPRNSDVYDYLARALQHYENYEKAAVTFELAAANSDDDENIFRLMRRAVVNYQRAGFATLCSRT